MWKHKKLSSIKTQLIADIKAIINKYEGRSEYAKGLGKMPPLGKLHALEYSCEHGLESCSHEKSFLE